MWYLFPTSSVMRLLRRDAQIDEPERQRIDDILGTTDWFNDFYSRRKEKKYQQMSFLPWSRINVTVAKGFTPDPSWFTTPHIAAQKLREMQFLKESIAYHQGMLLRYMRNGDYHRELMFNTVTHYAKGRLPASSPSFSESSGRTIIPQPIWRGIHLLPDSRAASASGKTLYLLAAPQREEELSWKQQKTGSPEARASCLPYTAPLQKKQGKKKADLARDIIEKVFPQQKLVVVGYQGKQPSFHIDMAMTPLGKKDPETCRPVITVGDPSLAVPILKDIKEKDPEKFKSYGVNIKEKLGTMGFFTKLFNKWGFDFRNPLNVLMKEVGGDEFLQESLDALAKGFEKDGYKVDRVPYLGSSDTDDVPWITYNNSVISEDSIFVPNFEIPELDEAGNSVYRKYGYTPLPIDMTAISSYSGASTVSPRCCRESIPICRKR